MENTSVEKNIILGREYFSEPVYMHICKQQISSSYTWFFPT